MTIFNILAKQRNEGLYLLDWISWHIAIGFNHFHITSNDCSDCSDVLLDVLSKETNLLTQYNLGKEELGSRSIGEWSFDKMNEVLEKNRDSFITCLDIDEYINFRNPEVQKIDQLQFGTNAQFHLQWINFVPEDIFNFKNQPAIIRNSSAIIKRNLNYPYSLGFSGKTIVFNQSGITLETYHDFLLNGKRLEKKKLPDVYLRHCPAGTIDEFALRSERGQATAQKQVASQAKKMGESVASREIHNYKYSIDLFLMYTSQGLKPKVGVNKNVVINALKIKQELLSNPKIKTAQQQIDDYYQKKLREISKSYIPSVVRDLKITDIDSLSVENLEKYNSSFFKNDQEKPHDFYVLMTLANLFAGDLSKAREYCSDGLRHYASLKLLTMMRSAILGSPYKSSP